MPDNGLNIGMVGIARNGQNWGIGVNMPKGNSLIGREIIPSKPSQIHIIGGPGAGKTTLAKRLSQSLNVETHKLDEIAYDPDSRSKQPLSSRLGQINSIASKPTWITEGVYLWWTEQLLLNADLIVWLDIPLLVALWRKIPHHLRRGLTGGYPHAGMRNQVDHNLFVWRYYRRTADLAPGFDDDDTAVT